MIKIRRFCLCLILLLGCSMTAQGMTLSYDGQSNENITLKINGEIISLDVPPMIIQDRTLIPSRGLFETLGAKVEWKGDTRQVVVLSQETEIILTVDASVATVNGQVVKLDVPAKIINDRAMIPVRFVSEHLGLSVGWDGKTKTVMVDQVCKYTVTNIHYNAEKSRVTVSANNPITGVKDSVLESNGLSRIVIDFPDAKMQMIKNKIATGSQVLTEIRCAQYKTIPFIGRLVLESVQQIPYHISYSGDKTELYLDLNFEELGVPSPTPTNTPTPPSSPTTPIAPGYELKEGARNLLVVIDPGHGGSDVGAVGKVNGTAVLYEKDVNLAIASKTNDLLVAAGVKTYMTRSTDVAVDLYARPDKANELNAALFLSVHNNAFATSAAHGTTVLYYPDSKLSEEDKKGVTSQRFAQILQEELVAALDRYDRGITDGAEMAVIRKADAPSVIAEIAFITNPEELALLRSDSFRDQAALALAKAVIRALNEMVS